MLFSLALIFLCGMGLGSLFQKLKLPALLGMLLTGILLGPSVLNLLDGSILAVSADLRARGMRFVGTTVVYAYLQAVGVIESHEEGCFLAEAAKQTGQQPEQTKEADA